MILWIRIRQKKDNILLSKVGKRKQETPEWQSPANDVNRTETFY